MIIKLVDADLLYNKKHRFPNLALMKISAYQKSMGNETVLVTDYNQINKDDTVYISKAFTVSEVPDYIMKLPNVSYGGTGFFYDKATSLEPEIEHIMPDYFLYAEWAELLLSSGVSRKKLKYYLDYSIGFTTRGCFRKCSFCVNKNSDQVTVHSPISEFVDSARPKICLLDDNLLGCSSWESILGELQSSGKKFRYKQGLDIRLLTPDKAKVLVNCKYDDDYTFAFDNIADKSIIEDKLRLWKTYNTTKGQNTKLYCFCGFDRSGVYDEAFWRQDIYDLFVRIEILGKYNCKPYIMRHENYKKSPYRGIYINVAQWGNQPSMFSNHSYWELCLKDNERKGGESATQRYNEVFIKDHPDIAERFFYKRMVSVYE